jgi:hypothetical protein
VSSTSEARTRLDDALKFIPELAGVDLTYFGLTRATSVPAWVAAHTTALDQVHQHAVHTIKNFSDDSHRPQAKVVHWHDFVSERRVRKQLSTMTDVQLPEIPKRTSAAKVAELCAQQCEKVHAAAHEDIASLILAERLVAREHLTSMSARLSAKPLASLSPHRIRVWKAAVENASKNNGELADLLLLLAASPKGLTVATDILREISKNCAGIVIAADVMQTEIARTAFDAR